MMESVHAPTLTFTNRVLRRLSISVRPFRALLRAYVLMDFRSQQFGRATGAKPKDLITPLFWVVGQYLLLSLIACAVLFARVDAFFFTLVNLGVSMLVIGTSLIVEFNEVVLDPEDLDVIGHQPIPARTYSAARLTNLCAYVLLITIALNLFPAIVGLGLRDTGWLYMPAYLAAAFLGNLAVTGVILLLYTMGKSGRPRDGVREILSWTQTVLIMIAFYGGQMVLRDSRDRLEMAAYNLPSWIAYLPPAWLADFVDSTTPTSAGVKWWILGLGFLVNIILWTLVVQRISVVYARMQPEGNAWQRVTLPALKNPGRLNGALARLHAVSRAESAAFWLCSIMLRRDQDLRMRSLPSLSAAIALFLVGLFTGQLGDPFVNRTAATSVLPVACLYLLAYPLPTIINNLSFSRDHQASWLLWTAPVRDRVAFAEGMRKAVTYRILLPVIVAFLLVFTIIWRDFLHALLHVAAGWLVVTGAGHATQIGILRRFPFSSPAARGAITGSIALFSAMVNATAMTLAVAHYFAARSLTGYAIYLAALAALVLVLRALSRSVIRQRFALNAAYE
ncbi:MAG TPA: hypothetical protein VM095_09020 [Pyrinomonadaceae bacterium]|nr:hypothetical protein [Pyrinomonadaceae bacterium]